MKTQIKDSKPSSVESIHFPMPRIIALIGIAIMLGWFLPDLRGAGTLSLSSSSDQPLEIRDHQVRVTINNGFARTEVTQMFFNANNHVVEGLYTFPVPKHASLSEVAIFSGETELRGEVVEKEQAESVYESESSQGNQAGLTQKDGYQDFEFWIAPIQSQTEVRLSFVYYEPLEIDSGIGRYVYPLEEGGTDEVTPTFWSRNTVVQGNFSIDIDLKSAWPVMDLRAPGFALVQTETSSGLSASYASPSGTLDQDFVLYYRLQDNLPGRVEMIPFKEGSEEPGTFMLVVTPGIDLKPLDQGSDYVFVLDVSGSMRGKLGTLISGVKQTLKTFNPKDRFRVIVFNNHAQELTRTWVPATQEQVEHAYRLLDSVNAGGGTNLFEGLELGLDEVDSDRVTNLLLVTDGVTNRGIVDPADFDSMMHKMDVRFFGFLLGNQSNWPLMQTLCEATGGYYKSVSNSDDIIGQIILAKNKVPFESIHDFNLRIKGVDTYDVSVTQIRKVFRGQQLVFFGRYAQGGIADLEIEARISGQEKVYSSRFEFPEVETGNPELERLWALNRIQTLELAKLLGKVDSSESDDAMTDLALQYQLVTDYTSMIVLTDEQFQRHGIDRRNLARSQKEREAQYARNQSAPRNYRVDKQKPTFTGNAPSPTNGGAGAISPWFILLIAPLLIVLCRKTFSPVNS